MSDDTRDGLPQRKHLRRLPRIFDPPPIYFVTICTLHRGRHLTEGTMPEALQAALRAAAQATGYLLGRYVIMPDHIHLFCRPLGQAKPLQDFAGRFKSHSTRAAWERGMSGKLWQTELHDHVLRSSESYALKWEYVRLNPVRAGLCQQADEWPHQGEFEPL